MSEGKRLVAFSFVPFIDFIGEVVEKIEDEKGNLKFLKVKRIISYAIDAVESGKVGIKVSTMGPSPINMTSLENELVINVSNLYYYTFEIPLKVVEEYNNKVKSMKEAVKNASQILLENAAKKVIDLKQK